MTGENLLIGDIGGTNARFVLVSSEQPDFHHAMTLQCSEFASADEAMRHFLEHQSAQIPAVICLAAAGPVVGDTVQVTNNHWTLNATEIAADFDIKAVRLPEMLQNSRFRNAFENKGRHRALMERIPTLLITHNEPGLLGASYCAMELSSS